MGKNQQTYKVNGLVVTEHGFPYPLLDKDCGPPSREHIEICKRWIKKWIDPRKNINRSKGAHTSYWLKHAVECLNDEKYIYVSNGSFIIAAAELDFKVKLTEPGSPNAVFNMDYKRLNEIILENQVSVC